MKLNKILILLVCFSLCLFTSCKKSEPKVIYVSVSETYSSADADSELEPKYCTTYEYDEIGNVICECEYSFNEGVKKLEEKYTYTYDESYNRISLKDEYFNDEVLGGYWIENYEYNASGDVIKTVEIDYEADGSEIRRYTETYTYKYDDKGNILEEVLHEEEYNDYTKREYTYDSLNRVTSYINSYKDAGDDEFSTQYKEVYAYNGDSENFSLNQYYEYYEDDFHLYRNTIYTYNEDGFITGLKIYYNEKIYNEYEYTYNTNGYKYSLYEFSDDNKILRSTVEYNFATKYDGENNDVASVITNGYLLDDLNQPYIYETQESIYTLDEHGNVTLVDNKYYEYDAFGTKNLYDKNTYEYAYKEIILEEGKTSKTGLVVGLSIGGVVLVGAAIGAVLFILKRKH